MAALADEDVRAALESINWDFSASIASQQIHKLHPYPARFIPEIPDALIALFHPGDRSAVLDPFCGSGTTLAVAVQRGLPSIGIELNPIAALIAKVRTTSLSGSLARRAKEVCARARMGAAEIPEIPRVDHWFRTDVQVALANLVEQINRIEEAAERDALRVALSRLIVRVSRQESDTRYAAIEKKASADDVYDLFMKSAYFVEDALAKAYGLQPTAQSHARIINDDVLAVRPSSISKTVGLVVTSPPYPNAYEYWLYHKYRMYWLGMNPLAVREKEIGARPHYFRKNHQTEKHFEDQMRAVFFLLSKTMRRGALACFLVGNSKIHGREIDNQSLLVRAAESSGFAFVAAVRREIRATRKAFNLSHARIRHEQIVILRAECS